MAKKNKNQQKTESGVKIIAVNRQARHEYIFEEFFEAGIALQGTEVKSLREGRLSLVDAYAVVDDFNQVWLKGLNISKWHYASTFNHEPMRARRLLLNKSEIRRLKARTHEKGLAEAPRTRDEECIGRILNQNTLDKSGLIHVITIVSS